MNDSNTTVILLFSLFYLAWADLKTLLKNIQQQGGVGVEKYLWNSKADVKVSVLALSLFLSLFIKNYQKNFKLWKFIIRINYPNLIDYKKSC